MFCHFFFFLFSLQPITGWDLCRRPSFCNRVSKESITLINILVLAFLLICFWIEFVSNMFCLIFIILYSRHTSPRIRFRIQVSQFKSGSSNNLSSCMPRITIFAFCFFFLFLYRVDGSCFSFPTSFAIVEVFLIFFYRPIRCRSFPAYTSEITGIQRTMHNSNDMGSLT